jgi:hypothetical protein
MDMVMTLQELKSVVKIGADNNAKTIRVHQAELGGRRRTYVVTVGPKPTAENPEPANLEFLLAPGRIMAEDTVVLLTEPVAE